MKREINCIWEMVMLYVTDVAGISTTVVHEGYNPMIELYTSSDMVNLNPIIVNSLYSTTYYIRIYYCITAVNVKNHYHYYDKS